MSSVPRTCCKRKNTISASSSISIDTEVFAVVEAGIVTELLVYTPSTLWYITIFNSTRVFIYAEKLTVLPNNSEGFSILYPTYPPAVISSHFAE